MPVHRPSRLALMLGLLALVPRPAAAQQQVSAWPLRVDTSAGQLSVYQPQPDSFDGDQLSARAAVSLLPSGAAEPEFGATWFKARVFTDRDARTVTIQDLDVRQVKLPNATGDQEAQFAAVLKGQLPSLNVTFSLDQLEATLSVVQKARVESQQLDNKPPRIVVTQVPTTLVVLDGQPKLQPLDDQPGVMRVVNTPFIIMLDGGSKQYYLKAGEAWMSAPAVTGPWQPAALVPGGVAAEGARLSVQNQSAPGDQPAAAAAPATAANTQILVAEEPTELISSDGPPQYAALPGNDLLYMSNTQSDVFLEVSTQRYFVLLSGRWFVAPSLNGPWAFQPADQLPAPFAQIPADSPKADVLVSVAGTQQAADARMDAYIPQTTAIHRDAGNGLTVTYDGDPQFVPVQGTSFTYANNCPDPVVCVGNAYYCCHQAVWYRAAAAVGPWVVSVSVPQEIYTIPPSCPIYSCRYVYVYDSTPDVVYCGYLPGYTGCYVYGPTVVYGTGYAYPYWYHRTFIPRPYTWGFAPRYDYVTATWGLGAGRRYDRTWFAAGPAVAVRHDWWGPQGYVDYREIRAARPTVVNNHYGDRGGDRFADRDRGDRGPVVVNNVRNVTINRINIYNRQENATRNVFVNNRTTVDNVRQTNVRNTNVRNDNVNVRNDNGRADNGRTDNRTANVREPDRGGNDVYAGRDGQVYRRTDQGWQERGARGWSSVPSTPQGGRVDRGNPGAVAPAEANRGGTANRGGAADHGGTADHGGAVDRGDTADRGGTVDRGGAVDRGDGPRGRGEAPARVEAPSDTGALEADRAARERGNYRGGGGGSPRGSGEGPANTPAPRGNGGGGSQGGGRGGNAGSAATPRGGDGAPGAARGGGAGGGSAAGGNGGRSPNR